MRTERDLERYLATKGISAEIIQLQDQVRTVPQAAAAVGVDERQIAKTLLFMAEDRPILVIAVGSERVKPAAVEGYLGLPAGSVILGTPEQVLAVTGYPVGTVPPMGHQQSLEVLVDDRLISLDFVYAGGGSSSTLLRITPDELVQHSEGRLIKLSDSDQSHDRDS